MLQPLLSVWSEMSLTRKAGTSAGVAVTLLAMFLMARIAFAPGFALLYGNLKPAQAGEIVSLLDQQGVQYEVRGNAIYVEEGRRDGLRMTLANEGLPTSGGAGYELLDKLSGFGTTSQMFDAAYARAIEGELARTITASSFVSEARVHISRPRGAVFQSENELSASVIVRPSGGNLSTDNAEALKFLVSSAISGLSVDDVTIIDAKTGLIVDNPRNSSAQPHSVSRSKDLQDGVLRLLEAHVGRGNAMVEVNLDVVTDTESIIERKFDPQGQVAVSTDTQEINRSSSGPAGGAVTVASNVPSGDAGGASGAAKSQDSEIRERTNFEISEVHREVHKVPGAIRRLTVAVLVNGVSENNETGETVWRPRSEEELSTLRELVQSAVGFREDRGDVVTIKSLEFETVDFLEGSASENSFSLVRLDLMTLIQLGVLSVVVLVLGLFVLRPVLMKREPSKGVQTLETDATADEMPQLTEQGSFEIDTNEREAEELPVLAPLGDFGTPMAVVDDFEFGDDAQLSSDDSVGQLKQMIEARKPDTIEILRGWLEASPSQEELV